MVLEISVAMPHCSGTPSSRAASSDWVVALIVASSFCFRYRYDLRREKVETRNGLVSYAFFGVWSPSCRCCASIAPSSLCFSYNLHSNDLHSTRKRLIWCAYVDAV